MIELQLIRVTQLVDFLKALESDNPAIFEKHEKLNKGRVKQDTRKIGFLRQKLINEYSRIEDTMAGSVSKPQALKDKIMIKVQVMEHVN